MNQELKPRILIVDDEEGIRFAFSCLLKEEGYEVDTVGNHDEALQLLDRTD